MKSLQSKTAWIVGASTGIGEALSLQLAANGVRLVVSARQTDILGALVTRLSGTSHAAVTCDVTNLESVAAAFDQVAAIIGTPDIVIYNVGSYEPMSAAAFDLEKAEAMLDSNFRGALRVLASVLPAFKDKRAGHLVLVASVAGYSGLPNAIGYGASKAALLHLGENLRLDLRTSNIKVQIVSPGFVKTRLTAKNKFKMPFIIEPDVAASHIVQGLETDTFDINFPKPLSLFLKFARLLPYPLYFRLMKNL